MEAIIYVFDHSTCFSNWWFRTVAKLRSIDNLYHDLNDKNDSSDDHDDFETPPPPVAFHLEMYQYLMSVAK